MKDEDKAETLVDIIIKGIQEKKGKEIINIDLTELENAVCEYFIICHGDSNVHVGAIADSVEQAVKESFNEKASHKEGFENAQWILLDFNSIVVHVFQKKFRDFYKLEELWADGNLERINEDLYLSKRKIN